MCPQAVAELEGAHEGFAGMFEDSKQRSSQGTQQAQQTQQTQQQAQQQAQQQVQHAQQHAQQAQHSQAQPVPSPFAAYAAIAPPDASWPPEQLQAGGAAAAPPAGSPRAAGTAASPRPLARSTFPHHTLSADLHMLFLAYADGQLSLPLPQGPSS